MSDNSGEQIVPLGNGPYGFTCLNCHSWVPYGSAHACVRSWQPVFGREDPAIAEIRDELARVRERLDNLESRRS